MSIITSFFLKKEKGNKFKEFETKWASDPKILKEAKIGWLGTRGNHLMQQNQLKEAINDFKEILEIDSERVDSYIALSSVYAREKDYLNAQNYLVDCKKIIEQSEDEKVKIRIADIYFFLGSLELELSDIEREEERRRARQEGVAKSFYMFLKEEKIVAQNPVWQELLEADDLMRDHGIMENTDIKNVSLRKQREERVKFAKEILTKVRDGLKTPEAKEMISKVLSD